MTEDAQSPTRPISVAELLAKNGTLGAPPAGGRRRRRRGNADAVSVAELTGEIPIIRDVDPAPEEAPAAAAADSVEDSADTVTETVAETVAETPAEDPAGSPVEEIGDETAAAAEPEPEPEPAPRPGKSGRKSTLFGRSGRKKRAPAAPVAEPAEPDGTEPDEQPAAAEPARTGTLERSAEPRPRRGPSAAPERSQYPRPRRKGDRPLESRPRGRGAELMSPDPIDVEDQAAVEAGPDELGIGGASYLKSTAGTLFGGETVADDMARRGRDLDADVAELSALGGTLQADPEAGFGEDFDDDFELAEDAEDGGSPADEYDELEYGEPLSAPQRFLRGLTVAVQCLVAAVLGGGLFIAFDQLWKWNSIAALVLGVLVILGLVVGVRIVRKTEDIASTLTAVAVGALVTFGPLALLQAN